MPRRSVTFGGGGEASSGASARTSGRRTGGRSSRFCHGRRPPARRDAVAEIEGVASYLDSEARIPFNEDGIFRHYEELDAA